jgi:hypothetical protein
VIFMNQMKGIEKRYHKISHLTKDGFSKVRTIKELKKEDPILNPGGGLDSIEVYAKSKFSYLIDRVSLENAIKEYMNKGNTDNIAYLFEKGDMIALCYQNDERVFQMINIE